VISPWSRPGIAQRRTYDHTSVLRMIEWRWNLPPLTFRDENANNLAETLDFISPPNLSPPTFSVPGGLFGLPCIPPDAEDVSDQLVLLSLREMGLAFGFPA
jgi:phospholipase C